LQEVIGLTVNGARNMTDICAVSVPAGGARGLAGFVYFITDGEATKIGYSAAPTRRLSDLQSGHAKRLKIVATFPGSFRQEQNLHAHFASTRIQGEWFKKDERLAHFIAKAEANRDYLSLGIVTLTDIASGRHKSLIAAYELPGQCNALSRSLVAQISTMPVEHQPIAERALMAALSVRQKAFRQSAAFRRAAMLDLAAYASLRDSTQAAS
jgi:hypothetical protein